MTNKPTKEEMRQHALRIRQNMAFEGFEMPLEQVIQQLEAFYGSDDPETISRLVNKARSENRSCFDVFAEHYKFKNTT